MRVVTISVNKLNDYELDELKRDIENEIKRRASGPTRVVYVVTEWEITGLC
ncbi:DUF5448 family protein (plasmid) [Salmonella enterica]|nr:DUF5448 family protein [Salmonella enterica]